MLKKSPVRFRSTRALLAATAAFALGAAASAGSPGMASASLVDASAPAEVQLSQANELLVRGQSIEGRSALMALLGPDGGQRLSDRERGRLYELLAQAERQIASADPADLCLQRASYALRRDNLVEADRQARAARELAGGSSVGADGLMSEIAQRRGELRSNLGWTVASILDAAERGDHASAREALATLDRSGLTLDARERALVERVRDRLQGVAIAGGRSSAAATVTLAVVSNEQPTDPEPDEPAGEPAPSDRDLIEAARRFEAQSLLGEANRAFDNRELNTAAENYARLLEEYRQFLSPEQAEQARDRLAEARTLLRGGRAPGGVLQDQVARNEVARQNAVAEFENFLAQARRSLETGDTAPARNLAAQARLTITARQDLFRQAEFENFQGQIDQILSRIATVEEQNRQQELSDRERRVREAQTEAESRQRQERDRRIGEALERVRALQMEQRYEEALQVIDEILFIDPQHVAGQLLRDAISNSSLYMRYDRARGDNMSSYANQFVRNMEALRMPDSVLDFPRDWPELSYRRTGALASDEPVENRRVLAAIQQQRLPANFQDNTLEEALGFIQTVTQLDMDVQWDELEDIGIDRQTPITLRLTEVPVETVLTRVLDRASRASFGSRADWAVVDGILTISSDEQLRRNTVLSIYDVRDLIVEVPDYDNAPALDLQSVLQAGQGGGGQSPFRDEQDGDREFVPFEERVLDLIEIIQRNVDPDGWEDAGGLTGSVYRLGGNLIISNTPKNHRAIRGLLSQLRATQALQINVETRFLLVSQDFFEQIGFDLDVYFNVNNNQARAAQAVDGTVQGSDFFSFSPTNADPRSGPGLRRTVSGAGVDTTGDGQPDIFPSQGIVNPTQWSPVGATQNSLGLANALIPSTGIAATVLGGAPALGVAGQFLDDIQVDFLVQATQADRRSVSLTAPRLTFTNGQTSNIWVATQRSFVSDLAPVVSDSAVGFDPTVEVVSEGVVMLVQGNVSADRRYVTLNVDAAVSTIDSFETQAVTAVAGGQLVSSADTQSFIQLPTVTVTRVQTTVTVPDQGTIMLGGQRIVNEAEVETGVPVLSKIPIISRFFSNRIELKEESTLLILLKPTIIIQNEEEERNFPGLLDSLSTGLGG
ncbi:MAG: hypothetical protein EA378_02910 [Phycisphaerales bacterium]|nr:MAG: hypothetical protein EA378_02910 [Phycisphaerales bacterium]